MKIVNLFYIIILLTNLLSAEPNPENKKIGLSLNMGKVLEFNSYLKEYDLNVQIQNGFSITQIEYRKLSQLWNNLGLGTLLYTQQLFFVCPTAYSAFLSQSIKKHQFICNYFSVTGQNPHTRIEYIFLLNFF